MPENTRFFIVGAGRSGSTLLRLLLTAHSRIHIPPETWFIIPLVERMPIEARLSTTQTEDVVDIIISNYRWPDMEIDAESLKRDSATLELPRLRQVIDLVYDHLLRRSGKARLGDKTPPYIAIVPQLAALYPEAKFIHLIRDGRDVAISYIEMTYECRFYDGRRFDWIAALEKARSYRRSEHAAQILEVRYENLVARQEATLREICTFLGEEFEPQMLDPQPRITAIPERERHIHRKINRPVSPDLIGVWRRKLSGIECFLMESCLRDYLIDFGYELRFRASAWQLLLMGMGWALRSSAWLLDRAVPYLRRRNLFPKNFYF
ncbi:MAG TPA: sulfotransferase [Rhizomicrobium sp.]|jgi:hypothetical protein|nr:sulfotransferase [Rhizomicrobium sp.]